MTSQRNVCSAPLTATKKFTAFSRQDHDDIILDVANAMLVFMMVIDDIDQANIFENPQLCDFKIGAYYDCGPLVQ